MSDVGYTDTPYGRCPIKSIRTLATPLITPLVQEFHHLSSSSSSSSSSSASLRELDAPFFPPWIGGGGRIYPWTDRIVGGGDGIRLSGRSVSGGGAVHARWFLERLVMPRRDVSTARWDRGLGDPWTGYYSWLFVAQFAGPTTDNEWKTAVCVAERACNARGCWLKVSERGGGGRKRKGFADVDARGL